MRHYTILTTNDPMLKAEVSEVVKVFCSMKANGIRYLVEPDVLALGTRRHREETKVGDKENAFSFTIVENELLSSAGDGYYSNNRKKTLHLFITNDCDIPSMYANVTPMWLFNFFKSEGL